MDWMPGEHPGVGSWTWRSGSTPPATRQGFSAMSRSTGKGSSQRQLRVGEQVRHALSEMLQRGEVRDDAIETTVISVSEVRMSPDLKIATAFVSPLGAKDGAVVIEALNRNARFIRGRMSPALRQMKYMPEFRFRLDTSYDNFAKIDELLRSPEVARDLGDDGKDKD
jgi:ribosome-binding factor A